jgi:uncharacterized protein YhjY with autotransporter beta-barrel domain
MAMDMKGISTHASLISGIAGGVMVLFSAPVCADLSDLSGGFATELEERSALANQATYDQLLAGGCTDAQRNPTETCGGSTFISWSAVRELVHTANDISGSGSTLFSLGLDIEGLGFSLRWTAGEEFSAHGDLSNSFVGGQLSGLANRISALRFGGSRIAVNTYQNEGLLVASHYLNGLSGGGASADQPAWSPWGTFFNSRYSYGNKRATEREDAFDFEGLTLSGGVDYRFLNNHVFGVMLGYQDDEIDFDSSQSIVDGNVTMDGFSLQPFYLYQSDNWYVNTSLGYQRMQFDMNRSIRYPSLNPDVDSTDTTALSKTDASAISSSSTIGMTISPLPAISFDVYASLDYQQIDVDGFRETDLQNLGFDFVVAAQDIDSLETATGIKLQYVWTPTFGVFIPYVDIQHRIQHKDKARNITAYYFNAEESLNDIADASFVLPTEAPESSYQIYTVGFSTILRGARQSGIDSAASGGIQAFMNVRFFEGLALLEQTQISGGLRYEF